MKCIFCSILLTLVSCTQIQVSKVNIDKTSLASTFARTPDPTQQSPPLGEKLYVSWRLPLNLKPEDHHVVLKVIYKDLTQEEVIYPMAHRLGTVSFTLLNEKFKSKNGFYAYEALLVNKEDKVIDKWQHQMWVNLID